MQNIFICAFADPGSTPGISTSTRPIPDGIGLAQCEHSLSISPNPFTKAFVMAGFEDAGPPRAL